MRIITLRDALQRASQNLKMYAAHMGVGGKGVGNHTWSAIRNPSRDRGRGHSQL